MCSDAHSIDITLIFFLKVFRKRFICNDFALFCKSGFASCFNRRREEPCIRHMSELTQMPSLHERFYQNKPLKGKIRHKLTHLKQFYRCRNIVIFDIVIKRLST